MKKETKEELFFTLPSFLWLLVFFLGPALLIAVFSFKPYDFYEGIGQGWTLTTWKNIFKPSEATIIFRTLYLSFIATFICLLISIPCGYAIAKAKKYRFILLTLIVLPFWTSSVVRVFAWKTLLHPEGYLKKFLVFIHLVKPQTLLLYNEGAILLVMVYSFLPFAVLPIFSAASKFNYELMDAAQDLGMSKQRAFFKIFIPGIQEGIFSAFLLVFISAIGTYVIPDIVGGISSEMVGNRIVQKTFVERDIPSASALSLIIAATILSLGGIIKFLFQKRKNYDSIQQVEEKWL